MLDQRPRLRRLLAGSIYSDDLTNLFLFVRDKSNGLETVRDIGDFIAHQNERDRGLTTHSMRNWYEIVSFHLTRFGRGGPSPLLLDALPPNTPEYLRAVTARLAKQKVGESRSAGRARENISRIIDNMRRNNDGTYSFIKIPSADEFDTFEQLTSTMIVEPAFEAEQLFDEFRSVLTSQKLLLAEELLAFDRLKNIIWLFAVTKMNNGHIRVRSGTNLRLRATGIAGSLNTIGVTVHIPIFQFHLTHPRCIQIATNVFDTKLRADEHCSSELLSLREWDFPIEVDQTGKLRRI